MEDLENGKISLSDTVVTSEYANSMGGAQIWLKVGETMSVEELLKAVFISSANDATVALAEHIAGSEDSAVERMNQRAKELGMTNTNFKNTTGLDEPDHYTTAMDIMIMSRELLKFDKIYDYTTVWMDTLRGGETQLVNTNKLIRFYKGAKGLKTGTTVGAGYCLSACAERDGLTLLSVTLGSQNTDDRFLSARRLLDYGFANYESVALPIDQNLFTPVKVNHGTQQFVNVNLITPQSVLVKKGQGKDIKTNVTLLENINAPVTQTTVLGEIKFTLGEETLASYPLTAQNTVEKITFFFSLNRLFKSFVKMI
jgi:D-alanyl-D-alanine carboxypeptidase (penicillin-binding protein 5/6)